MLVSEKLVAALNQQVGREMGASMQYLAIASHFASEALAELSRFYYDQSDEEREHALKFIKFIVDAGGTVEIPSIPAPKNRFSSAEEAVRLSLEWEQEVTRQIYELVELARSESNYIALRFLDWFVSEQLEEVATMSGLLQVVQRAGEERLLHVEEYLAREGDEIEAPEPDAG